MTEPRPLSLLGCFADFYAEVAREKLACTAAALPADADLGAIAGAASNRLCAFLDRQWHAVRHRGTPVELATYGELRLVMAAVADEAFLLDLPWRGRASWLGVMLEPRVCDSRSAGSHFFSYADRLIRADHRTPVARDAAAVLLLALRLGFQGRYRGAEGQRHLHGYRRKLFKLAGDGSDIAPPSHAFAQAYRHCVILPERHGRAWIAPPLRAAGRAVAAYLLLSALLWLWLVTPFLQRLAADLAAH